MSLVPVRRAPNQMPRASKALGGLLLAVFVQITAITASAAGPIASSSFVGVEDPLSENGAWTPLTSLWPNSGQLQKNDGAFPNLTGHAGAHTTAAVPADQYSEIVVAHVGSASSNVGPIVRVQTSGSEIDSHYLWWATQPGGGSNGLYRVDANGSSYTSQFLVPTSGVLDGDRLRLIARGPVIYGIKNGVRHFVYNPHTASFHYATGSTGVLAYAGDGLVANAKIASWSSGTAPVSSGTWASTNFAGTEDPLDEGDRWYPLPGYGGFKKQDGLALGVTADHNATAAWSITPPAKQYSQVTLGTVATGGGGPIVRIDRNAHGQTGWLLLLWADDPKLSGIYKLSSDTTGAAIFTPITSTYFTPSIVIGDSWRLTADGNTLTVSLNGVSQFTYTTDGSYASGDVGFHAYSQGFAFAGFEGGDVAGGADTQPPTAPTNLAATAASGTQINLAWTASTDNIAVTGYKVERCQNAGCTNFAEIATVTGTAYNNTGLTNGASYSYRVRATDAAGNLSSYSNVASASTPDTQPPTAPSNLAAKTISNTRINLSWTASTDNVGVTGYRLERCQNAGCTNFAQVATVTGTTYDDTGLTADRIYRYRVQATDAAGNLSLYSNVASANTDTTPPTAPTALAALPANASQINLVWIAATDNVGVTGYLVERCQGLGCTSFVQIAAVTGTTYNDTGLAVNTVYNYRVRATDAASNQGPFSNTATATTLALGL